MKRRTLLLGLLPLPALAQSDLAQAVRERLQRPEWLRGDFTQTKQVCESTKLFQLAVSLGAVESLIEQPASMSHASYDPADRKKHGITDGLIRLSVGLEDFDDLRQDLDKALTAALG